MLLILRLPLDCKVSTVSAKGRANRSDLRRTLDRIEALGGVLGSIDSCSSKSISLIKCRGGFIPILGPGD